MMLHTEGKAKAMVRIIFSKLGETCERRKME